jgi:hypothetical protein
MKTISVNDKQIETDDATLLAYQIIAKVGVDVQYSLMSDGLHDTGPAVSYGCQDKITITDGLRFVAVPPCGF